MAMECVDTHVAVTPPSSSISDDEEQETIAKRAKLANEGITDFVYPPESIPPPSHEVLEVYFKNAMEEPEGITNHQKQIEGSGILSFEQVILPAAAHQHEQVLKQYQKVVKRDAPKLEPAVVACRKLVYRTALAAREAVEKGREERALQKIEREKEKAREAARLRPERLLAKRKNYPENQAIWSETAYLLNELSQLDIEEEKCKKASLELDEYEASLASKCTSLLDQPSLAPNPPDVQDNLADTALENIEAAANEMIVTVAQVEDMLHKIQGIAKKAEGSRRELREMYRADHQFHGYQGNGNAKALVKVLSQSQNDDDYF